MNLDELVTIIRKEISGERALRNVAVISRYHRIPGYEGQVNSADEQQKILAESGIHAEAVAYPCDGDHVLARARAGRLAGAKRRTVLVVP